MRILVAVAVAATGLATAAWAQQSEIGTGEFAYVSELLSRGFEPFGVGGTQQFAFGMSDGEDLYVCLPADTEEMAAERRDALVAAIRDGAESRTLPNLPMACILTQ